MELVPSGRSNFKSGIASQLAVASGLVEAEASPLASVLLIKEIHDDDTAEFRA